LGLIFPGIAVHELGFRKRPQPLHFAPDFPGVFWYFNCLRIDAPSSASALIAPSAAAVGTTAAMAMSLRLEM